MPQIVVRTRDPFAVTLLCEWADHHDIETMAVSRPDDHDWVRVILYGLDDTDPLFHEFGKITLASYEDGERPWVPSSIDPFELSEIVTELASDRLLVHVTPVEKRACPECRGVGVSFDLDDVEVCGSCSGAGTV